MSDVKMDKRPYHSPLRHEQAQATRTRILDAALERFGDRGYAATSVSTIARSAGVAPETVYATFGSKRGIIDGLIARVASPRIVSDVESEWASRAGDPADQLGVIAHLASTFWSRNGALAAVFRSGTGDADIGDEWARRQADRRALFSHLLASWPEATFRPGLDRATAVDIVWALATDEVFHVFVRELGWSTASFEAWLLRALQRELLGG